MRKSCLWAALAVVATAAPALAEDCQPLQYYGGVPIDVTHGAILFPVTLNGKPFTMMLDTGGIANQLSRSVVQSLNLRERESPLELLNVSGNTSRTYVQVEKFSMGHLEVPNMQFQLSTVLGSGSTAGVAGMISSSFMHSLDVDLDFSAGRMNLFLTGHCPGKVIYWQTDTIAAVPITLDTTHIVVPVTVDGRAMRGIIDTGASLTTMNMTYATAYFSLSPSSPDMTVLDIHPNSDKGLNVYRHTFSSLAFEGVTVKNPTMVIMPDRVNSKANIIPTGSHIQDSSIALPELLIGMDILRKLHLYFSYKEHMLYITPLDDKAGKMLPAVAAWPAGTPAP